MLSKELAGEITDNIGRVTEIQQSGSDIYIYGQNHEHLGLYNIYELAHKCKEWAKNYFTLESAVSFDGDNKPYCRLIGDIDEELFEADTEPEAIFEACQWILDNKDK